MPMFRSSLRYGAAAVLAVLLLAGPVATRPALARPAPDSFAELAAKLLPSVVNISTTQTVKSEKRNGSGGDRGDRPLPHFRQIPHFNQPPGEKVLNFQPEYAIGVRVGPQHGFIRVGAFQTADVFMAREPRSSIRS